MVLMLARRLSPIRRNRSINKAVLHGLLMGSIMEIRHTNMLRRRIKKRVMHGKQLRRPKRSMRLSSCEGNLRSGFFGVAIPWGMEVFLWFIPAFGSLLTFCAASAGHAVPLLIGIGGSSPVRKGVGGACLLR